MKRWFSLALILALLSSTAFAENAEPAAEAADSALAAAGLVIEESETPQVDAGSPEDVLITDDGQTEVFSVRYGRVTADSAAVYADESAQEAFAAVPAGSVVLLVASAGQGRVQAAFFTGEAIVTGCIETAALAELTDAEISAYMDTAANSGPVAIYGDDLNRPLVPVSCTFAEPAKPAESSDETRAETAEPASEPEPAEPVEAPAEPAESPAEPVEAPAEPAEAPAEPAEAPADEVPQDAAVMAPEAVDNADNAEPAPAEAPVAATSISLNADSIYIGKKEFYTGLRAVPAPEGSVLPEITWRSSNSGIVAVNQNGEIYGRRIGSAYIYAAMAGGNEVACKVTVLNAPKRVYVSPVTLNLSEGMAAQLQTAVTRNSASGQLTFTSSDPSVAEVSPTGLVTALKPGTANITVQTYNSRVAVCKVAVFAAPASAAFAGETVSIGEGQKTALCAAAKAADGSDVPAAVTFAVDPTANDPECVTLNPATGEITGAHRGQVVIVATTHNGVTARCTVNVLAAPEGIALNYTTCAIGCKELFSGLAATLVAPADGSECAAEITWTTSNSRILAVNQKGEIYGRRIGTAYVYATTHNGKRVACKVTVLKAPSRVYVSPASLSMSAGGMIAQLNTAVTKKSASGLLTFTSSDPSVATVSPTGLVTALKPGSVTITVRSYNGRTAYCKVSVSAEPAKAAFAEASYTIGVGQKLAPALAAQDIDGRAVSANYTFAIDNNSSNSGCVTLDPATGEITAVSKGQAVITATTHNGVSASYTVNVLAAPARVSLTPSGVVIGKKEFYTGLAATLTPPAGDSECASVITWSSSNSKIVAVNQKGEIYGRKAGSAYIYAAAHNGVYARCRVVVRNAPTRIAISPVKASLKAGESGQYRVALNKGAGGTITWTSSNESVAVVDANGKVTAMGRGTAVITATTYNGKSARSTLTVSVTSASLPTNAYSSVESTTTQYSSGMSNAQKLEYVIYVAQCQLGKPYVYGGNGPSHYDCSGLTYYCFKQIGISLERSAYAQGYDRHYNKIYEPKDLKRGDLVFFNTNDSDGDLSDHAGLYLGNGYFIHASSSAKKVIISQFVSSSSNYYLRTFSWGYRVLN